MTIDDIMASIRFSVTYTSLLFFIDYNQSRCAVFQHKNALFCFRLFKGEVRGIWVNETDMPKRSTDSYIFKLVNNLIR